jgi:hypothetical protein
VDFPIKNGGSFHSFLYVHQRVKKKSLADDTNHGTPITRLFPTPGTPIGQPGGSGSFWVDPKASVPRWQIGVEKISWVYKTMVILQDI